MPWWMKLAVIGGIAGFIEWSIMALLWISMIGG